MRDDELEIPQDNMYSEGDSEPTLNFTNLQNLLKQAPAAMAVVHGREHRYTMANTLYQKLYSRREEDLLGKTIREVFPEIINQGVYELFDTAFSSGEAYVANEFPAIFDRRESGVLEKGYYNFVAQPIKDENGKVTDILIHAYEVTDQVVARQQVEESEKKYRSLFETMDQGFCIIEMLFDGSNKPVDYRFIEVNPTFEQQTGLKEAVGKTARELIPNLEAHWFEIYGSVALRGESIRFINDSKAMGRWFDVYAFRVGEAESRKVALLFTDITERKRNEQHFQQLYELTTQLSAAQSIQQVAEVIIQYTEKAFGGSTVGVFQLKEKSEIVHNVADRDLPLNILETIFPSLSESIQNKESVWFEDLDTVISQYPAFGEAMRQIGQVAFGCIPFSFERVIGGIYLFFDHPSPLQFNDRDLLRVMAQLCAQAFQRALLSEEDRLAAAVEERQRLARDLHDAVSQTLFSATVIAEALPPLWDRNPQRAFDQLSQVVRLNRAAMAEMRNLLLELRPEAILRTSLSELLRQLIEAATGKRSFETEFVVEGSVGILEEKAHVAFYRIAQESINNLVKHSGATQLSVQLRRNLTSVSLTVKDNGKGFDMNGLISGIGLRSMQERAEAIGADLQVRGEVGKGTQVLLVWRS